MSLPFGDTILMGADIAESVGAFGESDLVTGTNFSFSFSPKSREKADRIFVALMAGGEPIMAMQDTFWGSYFGMVRDPYAIQWLINFNPNDPNKSQ